MREWSAAPMIYAIQLCDARQSLEPRAGTISGLLNKSFVEARASSHFASIGQSGFLFLVVMTFVAVFGTDCTWIS